MKAIFLDRDGVINKSLVTNGKPYAPRTIKDFKIIPGVQKALLDSRSKGFLNIVVTNQPDISTGTLDISIINDMHFYMMNYLAIDHIEVCPHLESDNCNCRKPDIGMLLKASKIFNIDLTHSFMVGDRWRDVLCGQRAQCLKTFFIDYGYNEKKPEGSYIAVRDLKEAVEIILK